MFCWLCVNNKMATKNEEVKKFYNYLSILENALVDILKSPPETKDTASVAVIKRNKRLKDGDFTLIQPNQISARGGQVDTVDINHGIGKLAVTATNAVSVNDLKYDDKGNFTVKLNRPEVFSTILKEVFSKGVEFGKPEETCKSATVNVSFLHILQADYPGEITLSHVRALLLSHHVSALLEINGYKVEPMFFISIPSKFGNMCSSLGINLRNFDTNSEKYSTTRAQLRHSLNENANTYSSKRKCNTVTEDKATSVHPIENCDAEEESVLDLRGFMESKGLPCGKDGYDLNISIADFSEESEKFRQICDLEHNLQNLISAAPDLCVHVTAYEQLFSQQQVDLGWKILSNTVENVYQVHLPSGPVCPRKSSQTDLLPTADLFLSIRREQMRKAFRMKYGEQVQGEGWESTVESLTIAAVKFEFLTTNSRSPLKLDVSESFKGLTDTKGGVFVMYNCARLSTLFYNFEKAVEQGTYPGLPPLETIDFSCLKEEEEWELMFNYILPYPSVVASCLASLSNRKPRSQIHAHKICQFLLDLSRDFSSYYNRIHVLGEAREHLLQTMYARIYLLKAVEQVMHNALSLLDIQPLSQL